MNVNIFWALLICVSVVQCNNDEDTWIQPNAWGREAHNNLLELGLDMDIVESPVVRKVASITGEQSTCATKESTVAFVYYKKLIGNLFNRKKFQYDETRKEYKRVIVLNVKLEQMEKIEQLIDPRDLDTILTEVLAKSQTPFKYQSGIFVEEPSTFMLFLDIFKDLRHLLKHSEVQFTLIVAIAILVGWHIHRRYHIGIITLIIGGFFLFGYFITYLECNRKLEVDQMLAVLEENDKKADAEIERGWFSRIFTFYSADDEKKKYQHEKLKKSKKLQLAYCRPDHVLMMYANELFLKQLEFLMEKCTSTIISLKDKLSFPYNFLAATLMIGLICYIVKLTFKYILSPKAWFGVFYQSRRSHPHQQDQQQHTAIGQANVAAITEDRISGENLKLLLNAITNPPANRNVNVAAVSGVQEVLEPIEAARESESFSSTSVNSSVEEREVAMTEKSQNNNGTALNLVTKKNVSIEDVPDDKKES